MRGSRRPPGADHPATGVHTDLRGKLEASKSAGWLSHYLVAWHRMGSRFTPEVRIWRVADQNTNGWFLQICFTF